MKRIYLSFLLTIALFLPAPTNAHAVLGLSKCEKVKKEVISLEQKINVYINKYSKYWGYSVPTNLVKEFEFANAEQNDFARKVFKVAYNNPKCFTRTQNSAIEQARKYGGTLSSYLHYEYRQISKKTPECDVLFKPAGCVIGVEYLIGFLEPYKSIYAY